MKHKSFKGFTLVECIVALALFAIAALTMAQIYAQVGLMNKKNHSNNTSLAYQMKIVENTTGADAISLPFNPSAHGASNQPPHHTPTTKDFISIQRKDGTGTVIAEYSYGVDTFVLLTRHFDNTTNTDKAVNATDEADDNLRYKYFIGKK